MRNVLSKSALHNFSNIAKMKSTKFDKSADKEKQKVQKKVQQSLVKTQPEKSKIFRRPLPFDH